MDTSGLRQERESWYFMIWFCEKWNISIMTNTGNWKKSWIIQGVLDILNTKHKLNFLIQNYLHKMWCGTKANCKYIQKRILSIRCITKNILYSKDKCDHTIIEFTYLSISQSYHIAMHCDESMLGFFFVQLTVEVYLFIIVINRWDKFS